MFKKYKEYKEKDIRISVFEKPAGNIKEGICFCASYPEEDIWREKENDGVGNYCLKRELTRTDWANIRGIDAAVASDEFINAIAKFNSGEFEDPVLKHFLDMVEEKLNLTK